MITAIVKLFTVVLEFLMFWKHKKAGDVIVRTAEIYDEMRKIVNDYGLGVHRFLVVKAHNGGGDFRNDAMAYATVLHEQVRKPLYTTKYNYQNIPIDGYYNEMLKKIYVDGDFLISTDTMDKESLLGNMYLVDRVKHSRLFFLKHSKKGFWFCSIETSDEDNNLETPEHNMALMVAISKIKERI